MDADEFFEDVAPPMVWVVSIDPAVPPDAGDDYKITGPCKTRLFSSLEAAQFWAEDILLGDLRHPEAPNGWTAFVEAFIFGFDSNDLRHGRRVDVVSIDWLGWVKDGTVQWDSWESTAVPGHPLIGLALPFPC